MVNILLHSCELHDVACLVMYHSPLLSDTPLSAQYFSICVVVLGLYVGYRQWDIYAVWQVCLFRGINQ